MKNFEKIASSVNSKFCIIQNKFKKFYNSVMLRSKLTIAGSNFIFNHINESDVPYLIAEIGINHNGNLEIY